MVFGRLVFEVVRADNLINLDGPKGHSDPYCIVRFGNHELGRTKTLVDQPAPVWNQVLYLDVHEESVENISLEVWDSDDDTGAQDQLIGKLSIPFQDISSTKKQKQNPNEDHPVTSDLVNAGKAAGTITYKAGFRKFGQTLAEARTGAKRALQIGINYLDLPVGKGRLNGCFHDVEVMNRLLLNHFGFSAENIKILRDDDTQHMPTRKNIEDNIKWLITDAKAGDSLFMQFSGHGGQATDQDGDEEDGLDETLIPCDFRSAGQITDDQLFKSLITPLPAGVFLTIVMDCCHSGTGMDLPFVHKIQTSKTSAEEEFSQKKLGSKKDAKRALKDEKKAKKDKGDKKEKEDKKGKKDKEEKEKKGKKEKDDKKGKKEKKGKKDSKSVEKKFDNSSDANAVMFSGCLDHQTSSDAKIEGKFSGAMTYSLVTALEKCNYQINYRQLLTNMHQILTDGKYAQIPQLSTARPFNLDSKYNI